MDKKEKKKTTSRAVNLHQNDAQSQSIQNIGNAATTWEVITVCCVYPQINGPESLLVAWSCTRGNLRE